MNNKSEPTYTVTYEQLRTLWANSFVGAALRGIPSFVNAESRELIIRQVRLSAEEQFERHSKQYLREVDIIEDEVPGLPKDEIDVIILKLSLLRTEMSSLKMRVSKLEAR